MSRWLAALALVALAGIAGLAAGCGDDAREAVDSVTAEIGAELDEARQDLQADIDRAQAASTT